MTEDVRDCSAMGLLIRKCRDPASGGLLMLIAALFLFALTTGTEAAPISDLSRYARPNVSHSARPHAEPDADLEYLFEMKGTAPFGLVTHPGAMAAAPDGSVYVVDAEDHRIVRFDRDGNVISAWGSYGTAHGQFFVPVDVAVAPDGTVYVSDSANFRVQRFTADGTHLTSWGGEGTSDGTFRTWGRYYSTYGPGSLTVDVDGRVHVEDRHRVQVFSPDGAYLRDWSYPVTSDYARTLRIVALRSEPSGTILALNDAWHDERGTGITFLQRYDTSGTLLEEWELTDVLRAYGMAVAGDGSIFVTQRTGLPSVLHYSATGELLGSWGSYSDSEPGQMFNPVGVAALPGGTVLIGDVRARRIQRFSADGTFEAKWAEGSPDPASSRPVDLAITSSGDLYVAVQREGIHLFNVRGERVGTWGGESTGKSEFNGLSDISVGPSGRVYTVEDWEHRVQVFEPDGTSVSAWGRRVASSADSPAHVYSP